MLRLAAGLAIAALWVMAIASHLDLVTLRHELRAEREARCAAEVALERERRPAHVAAVSVAHAGGGPDADCRLLDAVRAR